LTLGDFLDAEDYGAEYIAVVTGQIVVRMTGQSNEQGWGFVRKLGETEGGYRLTLGGFLDAEDYRAEYIAVVNTTQQPHDANVFKINKTCFCFRLLLRRLCYVVYKQKFNQAILAEYAASDVHDIFDIKPIAL